MLAKITGNKAILGAVVGVAGGLVVAVLLVVVLGVGSSPAPAAGEAASGGEKSATAQKAAPAAAKTPAKGVAPAGEVHAFGPTFLIKDRIVNLADAGGRRYLRFSVAIEFAEKEEKAAVGTNHLALYVPEADAPEYQDVTGGKVDPEKEFLARIKKYTPAMEDVVMTVLSSKTSADIASAEGKEASKREIKERIQRILGDQETVTNVYFTEFVMQ